MKEFSTHRRPGENSAWRAVFAGMTICVLFNGIANATAEELAIQAGRAAYLNQCARCHSRATADG